VLKRNGVLQDFNRNKIINGLLKAGASNAIAEKVAREVEKWLPTAAENGTIDSIRIRSQVVNALRRLSPVTASSFDSHRKSA
jgi:transcriptional regulator NrdR family protein